MMATKTQLQEIAKDAAFLLAAMGDRTMTPEGKRKEIADTVADLQPKLKAAGFMEAFRQDHGGYGLWG